MLIIMNVILSGFFGSFIYDVINVTYDMNTQIICAVLYVVRDLDMVLLTIVRCVLHVKKLPTQFIT